MKSLSSLVLTVLFVGSMSCKTTTSNDPMPTGAAKLELIAGKISKSWEITAIGINNVDVFSLNRACTKDDIFLLNANKTYELNEGPTKCRTTDVQVYEKGTWELSADESELVLNKKSRYKILELSSSSLKLSNKNLPGEVIDKSYKALSSN